jgi:Rieske Fe-S protein
MSREPKSGSRRRFLKLAVVVPLSGCIPEEEVDEETPDSEDPTPAGPGPVSEDPVEAGHIDDLDENSLQPVDGFRLALGRDQDGIWAVSTHCTHLGCDISDRATNGIIDFGGIECGCHGSRYDRDGDVQNGPSVRDLGNYAVEILADGSILVDMTTIVSKGTRASLVLA